MRRHDYGHDFDTFNARNIVVMRRMVHGIIRSWNHVPPVNDARKSHSSDNLQYDGRCPAAWQCRNYDALRKQISYYAVAPGQQRFAAFAMLHSCFAHHRKS